MGATLITLGPLLDPILRDLHIPLAKGGLLSFGFFLGRVAGVLLLNFGLARVPIKTIMVTCAVVLTLGSAACGLLGVGLWPLSLALFVTGLAGVIPNAVSGVWVAAHIHKGVEKAMLNIGAYFALGVVVAPLVIGAALELGATWRWVFLGEAVFSAVVAIVLMILPIADVRDRENLRAGQLKAVAGSHPSLLAVILGATFLYVCVEGTLVCVAGQAPGGLVRRRTGRGGAQRDSLLGGHHRRAVCRRAADPLRFGREAPCGLRLSCSLFLWPDWRWPRPLPSRRLSRSSQG